MVLVDNDPNQSLYPNVNEAVSKYLDNYRTTVGAAALPQYLYWIDLDDFWIKSIGIALVWVIWILSTYINQIIIKNFLINYVRVLFSNIVADQSKHNYVQVA